MILGVEKLARQLGVDVTPYCFQENSLLEIRRCVEQAARDGKRVIIGGGTGCRLAEEIGLTPCSLPPAGGILERHLGGQAAGQDQSGGTGEP